VGITVLYPVEFLPFYHNKSIINIWGDELHIHHSVGTKRIQSDMSRLLT
jgi:hypothetical protein